MWNPTWLVVLLGDRGQIHKITIRTGRPMPKRANTLGNLIDRVRFGAVVDFINAGALHFPWVFNVADAAISVGAVLLFFDQFVLSGGKPSGKPDRPSKT